MPLATYARISVVVFLRTEALALQNSYAENSSCHKNVAASWAEQSRDCKSLGEFHRMLRVT